MAATMQFAFQFQAGPKGTRVEPDQPMKILLMANLSGQRGNTIAPAQRRPRKVDIDNMDQVLAACAPVLQLDLPELGQQSLQLQFASFDDFSPEHLYRSLPLFQSLRDTRQALQNPATFAAAAAQLGFAPAAAAAAPVAAPAVGNDFASLLAGNVAGLAAAKPAANQQFEALIRSLAAPHIVTAHDPAPWIATVDAAISSLMRAILRHPSFQSLEASWRGIHFLITNLDLDENLQLHVLDLSQPELAADLAAAGPVLHQSALYHLLVEAPRQAPDATPWGILLGDYQFDHSEAGVSQLAALGALAERAGAPWLAAAHDSILGCQSLQRDTEPRDWPAVPAEAKERWQALRSSPQAAWLGLVLPRLLMRLPYGRGSDAIDAFDFEECPTEHAHFLWGHAGMACALLLAQAYQEDGWEMQLGGALDILDLPAYTYKVDGESHLLPAAETYLLERSGEAIQQAGLMALASYKNKNAVRLLRIQSLASPARALAGAWHS